MCNHLNILQINEKELTSLTTIIIQVFIKNIFMVRFRIPYYGLPRQQYTIFLSIELRIPWRILIIAPRTHNRSKKEISFFEVHTLWLWPFLIFCRYFDLRGFFLVDHFLNWQRQSINYYLIILLLSPHSNVSGKWSIYL